MISNFFSDVFGEFGGLTNRAWLLFFASGVAVAAADLVAWSNGPGLSLADYVSFALTVPIALIAQYFAGMSMVSRRLSATGFVRFAAGFFALFSLPIIGIASILMLLPSPSSGVILSVAIALICIGWLALVFLPAWPIAQALSSKTVLPIRLLRGTKGHRWSLFLISFVGGSLNSLIPATGKAHSLFQALVYAVGNSAINMFNSALFVVLSVTAWRYASASDKGLYGDEPRAAGVF